METRLAKKKKLLLLQKETQQQTDLFDNLQDELIHHILNFLPIKDIARTSLVSKRWRSIWQSLPDLDFTAIKRRTLKQSLNCDSELHKFLYFASKRHDAEVKKVKDFLFINDKKKDFISPILTLRYRQRNFFNLRTLKVRAIMSCTCLNHLIRCAMQVNIRELYLDVATENHFNLPKRVLSSPSLEVFQFKSEFPGFRLPPVSLIRSGGFRSLKNLSLSNILLDGNSKFVDMFDGSSFPVLKELHLSCYSMLEHLIVRCPVLEVLGIEDCSYISKLEIYSTELKGLYVSSCFRRASRVFIKIVGPGLRWLEWKENAVVEINFAQDFTGLKECCVAFAFDFVILNDTRASCITRFLSAIRHARTLRLSPDSTKVLHKLMLRMDMLDPFINLRCLKVAAYSDSLPALSYLIRISPRLHTLVILMATYFSFEPWRMSASEMDRYWHYEGEVMEPFLCTIKVVKIDGFSEDEYNEVCLVQFLLKHAKNLEEMTIRRGYNGEFSLGEEVRAKIKKLAKGASKARLIY